LINWLQGGCTGSIRRWVAAEVREHRRTNPAILRNRYPGSLRLLRSVMFRRTYATFIKLYFAFFVVAIVADDLLYRYADNLFPRWASPTPEVKALIHSTAGYLVTAQVGALAIVSLAVGLISVITERGASGPALDIYYDESLASEILASSLALLSVLCFQLLWPIHFVSHILGLGAPSLVFKLSLTLFHLVWLIVNLWGAAHFISLSLQFVQPANRNKIRIRYTANLLIPQDLRERIKRVLYLNAGEELLEDWDRHNDPLVIFGRLFGRSRDSEIERVFLAPSKLYDVRVRLLRWALRRWALRCRSERNNLGAAGPAGLSSQPVIVFLPDFDGLLEQRVAWCQREGGVPLNRFEKLLIRWSFRFRQVTS
jgi:hypothetical protein